MNLRPTQLLRCPDGKGGILLQDTPCKAPTPTPGTATTAAPEVTDLSQLAPRPQAEAPAPRVDDGASNRWTQGMLWGAGKLAALLAAIYAVYRIGLYAARPAAGAHAAAADGKPGAAPYPLGGPQTAPQRGAFIVVRCR